MGGEDCCRSSMPRCTSTHTRGADMVAVALLLWIRSIQYTTLLECAVYVLLNGYEQSYATYVFERNPQSSESHPRSAVGW
jgi:hypothetical protein